LPTLPRPKAETRLLTRWLDSNGRMGAAPEWYTRLLIADRAHISVFELYDEPRLWWELRVLEARNAETWAENKAQEKARREAKRGR